MKELKEIFRRASKTGAENEGKLFENRIKNEANSKENKDTSERDIDE